MVLLAVADPREHSQPACGASRAVRWQCCCGLRRGAEGAPWNSGGTILRYTVVLLLYCTVLLLILSHVLTLISFSTLLYTIVSYCPC